MEIVLVVVVAAAVAGVVAFAARPRGARYPAVGGAAAMPPASMSVKAAAPAGTARSGTGEARGALAEAETEPPPSEAQVAGMRENLEEELRARRSEIARIEERLLSKEE